MRLLSLILICLLPATAIADIRSCQKLYSSAPKSLVDFRLTRGSNLENRRKGTGFSTKYRDANGVKVSVFYYDDGKRRLSSKHLSQDFALSTHAVAAVKRKKGDTEAIVEIHPFKNLHQHIVLAAHVLVGPTRKQTDNDYIAMGIVENCFVKLRATLPGSRKSADRRFDGIAHALDKMIAQ